ncbi:MAG: SDR family NAD(P)-dependent oxidoreductase [Halieaceae bacterium]|nr:SDR family NAD(P)-dependent oxidoreductase [Halieaceae bacterium]
MSYFRGKRAVITGAGSGIGRALAVALNARGCHLELADIRTESLKQTQLLLQDPAAECHLQTLDVADATAVSTWAQSIAKRCTAVDIVINNAGVALGGTAEENSLQDLQWLMGINFWGVVHGCKAFLPLLHQAGGGHLVNLSSVFGLVSVPTQSAYNASKFAVRGYTEALRQELADTGIHVCCVHPGGVKTDIARSARSGRPDGQAPPFANRFEAFARTTAEAAALQILNAIQKRAPRLVIGVDGKLMSLVVRAFPASYPRILRWLTGAAAANLLTTD